MPDFVFKEMLEIAKPFHPEDVDLDHLARCMIENPKSAVGNPNSKVIPAGYTYLGQFIDHDISLDSHSDRKNQAHHPWNNIDPLIIRNLRNPVFDLEILYGNEDPPDSGIFPRTDLLETGSQSRLKLGETIAEGVSDNDNLKRSYWYDLPRNPFTGEAKIYDSRNDANLIVAQIHVAFIKFHNAVASKFFGNTDTPEVFREARKITIRHYQHIILNDFLPKIIKRTILEEVKAEVLAGNNKFYHPTPADRFIPLEFSAAAFRAGHSMIRNTYNWNNVFNFKQGTDVTLTGLMNLTGSQKVGGKNRLRSIWIINWNWFFDIDSSKDEQEFNFAKKINTHISKLLGKLIPHIEIPLRANSLPALDLYRGRALKLPTGQEVAEKIASQINAEILSSAEIESKLAELESKLPENEQKNLPEIFKDETPLWFYLLAEAEIQNDGEVLGDVGSRIVAEIFLKLLYESPYSILKNELETDENFLAKDNKTFGMAEMLKFIAEQNTEFNELNPTEKSS